MLKGNQLSLSQITNSASLGLKTDTQSIFTSAISTNASQFIGNITTVFNNELNTYLTDLNTERAIINAKLQEQLSVNPNYLGMRNKGISLAWKYEYADAMMGGRGTVDRGWTDFESEQLKENRKVKVNDPDYDEIRTPEGHHINNAADHPSEQANPDNIKFYKSREDHINKGHNGNTNNPSSGELIDKNAKLIKTNKQRVIRNELRGIAITAGIGFGVGFTLSAIAEIALKGFSSIDVGELIAHSTISGIETSVISLMGYGAGRLTTSLIKKLGIDVLSNVGGIVNYSAIGLTATAVISIYQYIKLRLKGVDVTEAKSRVIKQGTFSISTLCVSMLAQGIYGGCAGIIVSTSIGLIYFGYNVAKIASQRQKEEKLRVDIITAYKELILS